MMEITEIDKMDRTDVFFFLMRNVLLLLTGGFLKAFASIDGLALLLNSLPTPQVVLGWPCHLTSVRQNIDDRGITNYISFRLLDNRRDGVSPIDVQGCGCLHDLHGLSLAYQGAWRLSAALVQPAGVAYAHLDILCVSAMNGRHGCCAIAGMLRAANPPCHMGITSFGIVKLLYT